MSTSSTAQRKSDRGLYTKEIKKIENKLKFKVRDLKARNKLIVQLNTYLRLSGQNHQYKKETIEDKHIHEYNNKHRRVG